MQTRLEDHRYLGNTASIHRSLRQAHQPGKRNPLVIPLLLAMPVIIIAGIISFSWKKDSENNLPLQLKQEAITVPQGETPGKTANAVILNSTTTTLVPGRDTVVKNRRQQSFRPAAISTLSSMQDIGEVIRITPAFTVSNRRLKDIRFDIANRSALPLELVAVELQYNHPGLHSTRSETLYVKDIPAGGRKTLVIRDADIAESLAYSVSLVSAKDTSLYLVSR
ncbi:MAG TPA: hypothetical protein VF145_02785 [Chitinophagaceae bacterium]